MGSRHGQRRGQDEQSRDAREQGERQSWRSGSEGQRNVGGQSDWPTEESGFSGEHGRRGSGQGAMEDFANRRGGPEQESWRERGQPSGSGWGPEQEFGQGSYRGDRRSWEGEQRGGSMDRQREYRQGGHGQGGYGQTEGQQYGQERSGQSGWGQGEYRGGNQGGAGGGWAQEGRGQQSRGGQFGQSGYEPNSDRSDYGSLFGQPGGMGQGAGQGEYGTQRFGERQGGYGAGTGGGPYAGRGPKGYRRSDDRIKEDVCEQLTQHPDIDASDVEIKVQSGEVTLTGTVDSRQAKRMVEDVVDSASGVKDVNNQLRVKRSDVGTGSDGAGTSEAQGSKSRT